MMITRHRDLPLLMLGLFLGSGCGGTSSGFHQSPRSQPCRRDAAADAMVRDAAADAILWDAADGTVDALWSGDSTGDGGPRDIEPGLDSGVADDGEGDGGTSDDACDDVAGQDGGKACGASPWRLQGQVPNVRQLGGVRTMAGDTVACDLIYRGSALSPMTPEGCGQFAAMGVRTVVDLRSESEQTSPPAACVRERASLVSAPMPTPYNVSPADYLADLYTASSIQKAFAVLADRASYPVYYHCLYGKDRTGVLTAVILTALGVSRAIIHEEYALSGEAGFSYYPASLDAVLNEFDRLGGIDAYFRAVGVPAEQVEAMRAILLPTSP